MCDTRTCIDRSGAQSCLLCEFSCTQVVAAVLFIYLFINFANFALIVPEPSESASFRAWTWDNYRGTVIWLWFLRFNHKVPEFGFCFSVEKFLRWKCAEKN